MEEKPLDEEQLKLILTERLGQIRAWDSELGSLRVAYPVTTPLNGLIPAIHPFIERNSNNAGTHFGAITELNGTRSLENESISALGILFHDRSSEGWLTCGGTEGNISGMWLGREYLRAVGCKRIAVVASHLSHDSVVKAARLLSLENFIKIALDSEYRMSTEQLKEILIGGQESFDGVIVIATVGATETGTCDAVDRVAEVLRNVVGLRFYLHVDAAFGGLVLPFSDPQRLFDFHLREVSSISVDLHKMGQAPIGCGAFLCRLGLSDYLKQDSTYGHVDDRTLLGSRPGSTAAVAWYSIFSQGRQGFLARVEYCLTRKSEFLRLLDERHLMAALIHDKYMNVAAISFVTHSEKEFKETLYKDLRLQPSKLSWNGSSGQGQEFYRFYFMPHLNSDKVVELVERIEAATIKLGES